MQEIKIHKTIDELTEQRFIDRLFAPDVSEEEMEDIRMWLAGDGNEAIDGEALRNKFIETLKYEENSKYAAEMWPKLAERLGLDADYNNNRTTGAAVRIPLRRRMAFKVAATLMPLLIIGGALGLLVYKTGDRTGGYVTEYVTEEVMEEVTEEITESAVGTQRHIKLPDGSTVELTPGTELSYAENFVGNRVLKFSGEGLFDVAKRQTEDGYPQPFTVTTGNLTVEVLGTVFRLSDPLLSDQSLVALYEGSVSVGVADTVLKLTPGEKLALNNNTKQFTVSLIPATEMAANGFKPLMRFEESNLENLIAAIEANFGVEFILSEGVDIANGRVMANFEEVSLEKVLGMLTRSSGSFTFSQKGVQIIVANK